MSKLITPPQNSSKYSKQNPWVSLLRIFMCFVVIFVHFRPTNETILKRFIGIFGTIAVPCFMFLSFFFMANDIKSLNFEKLKKRLARLYAPIFVWNIVYWISKNLISLILNRKSELISFKGLIEGLLFTHYGGDMPVQLWFLFSQIIILILICMLTSYAKNDKDKTVVLLLMVIAAFILQYTGVNFELFDNSVYAVKYSLGRCIECIPYAVSGIIFSWYKDKMGSIKKVVLFISLAILTVLSKLFIPKLTGFGYGGFYLLLSSTAICVFVFIMPDIIKGKLRYAINYFGSCTMGIYCLHLMMGRLILPTVISKISVLRNIIHRDTFMYDVIIFISCLIITVFIRLINKKLNWKWVEYIV